MSNNNSWVVKYAKAGHKFQIFVERGSIQDFKEGKRTIQSICLADTIASESGEKVSDTVLTEVFGTTDVWKCLEEIALHGEPQLSVQEKRQLMDAKRKQIVEYIAKTYIDGKTKLPHPHTRIENGLDTIKGLKIELNVPVGKQGDDIVNKLKGTMSFVKNESHGYIYVGFG